MRAESLGEILTEVPVVVVGRPEPPPVVVVVVLVVLAGPGPGEAPDVSHQRFVLGPAVGVVNLPAPVTEVVEAAPLSTEVGTLLHGAHTAEGVLQVGIHLPGHTWSYKKYYEGLLRLTWTFLLNLGVLISMKAAETAFM